MRENARWVLCCKRTSTEKLTQAKTLEELYPRIREVIELCMEEEEPTNLEFVGIQRVELG